MDHKSEIDRLVKDLPPGGQLFVPEDVADDMFGIGQGAKELDKISKTNGCDTGFVQSFESSPDEKGTRITKPR